MIFSQGDYNSYGSFHIFIHSPKKLLGAFILLGTVISARGKKEELGTDLSTNDLKTGREVDTHTHTHTHTHIQAYHIYTALYFILH